MKFTRKVPFRIQGQSGIPIWPSGKLAKFEEETLLSDVYLCLKCGHIEMFVDEKAKQFLLKTPPGVFLKRCVECSKNIPIASEECPHCNIMQKKATP